MSETKPTERNGSGIETLHSKALWVTNLSVGVGLAAALIWLGGRESCSAALVWAVSSLVLCALFFVAVMRHRRVEAALRLSEQRYRKMVETAQEGIWLLGPDGHTTFVNERMADMLGYDVTEMVGRPFLDFVAVSEHKEAEGCLERSRHGVSGQDDLRLRRKDGSQLLALMSIGRIRSDGGRLIGTLAMVVDITKRRRLEKEILEISAGEQQRIGRDLHDGLCQHLAGVGFMAKTLAEKLGATSPPEARDAERIRDLIEEAVVETRRIVRGLSPVEVEGEGLMAALDGLACEAERHFGISCVFAPDRTVLVHDNTVATHLFRIAQEAVTNAGRHSKCRHVLIDLTTSNGTVQMGVTDDGVGLPAELDETQGWGIRIMNYRARMIGASLYVERAADEGTTVRCVLRSAADTARTKSGTVASSRQALTSKPPPGSPAAPAR